MICWLPPDDPAHEAAAPITSRVNDRKALTLLELVDQFQVEIAPRYKVRDYDGNGTLETWCNRFACDVARAMRVTLPYCTVSKMLPWLAGKEGVAFGWREASELEARRAALHGELALAIAGPAQPGQHGHVAVLVPPLAHETVGMTYIAQAGRINYRKTTITRGFGSTRVRFFTHP